MCWSAFSAQGPPASDAGIGCKDLGGPLSGDRGIPANRRVRHLQELRSAQSDALHSSARRARRPHGLEIAAAGVYRGFRESYKTEIAAYELDKLLKMDMVPPTVERQLDGIRGAAQLWVENIVGLKDAERDQTSRQPAAWENQLVRMRMFATSLATRIEAWETCSAMPRGTCS